MGKRAARFFRFDADPVTRNSVRSVAPCHIRCRDQGTLTNRNRARARAKTNAHSLHLQWREDINSKVVLANNEPIPCLLLANKCDIPGVTIDRQGLDEFVKKHGFIGWYETSAQEDINIGTFSLPSLSLSLVLGFRSSQPRSLTRAIASCPDEAMMRLIKEILKVSHANAPPTAGKTVSLDAKPENTAVETKEEGGCCS